MISINVMLGIFIILFALAGAMRGWAKEMLVTFSVILAMFTLSVLESFVPFFKESLETMTPESVFYMKSGILAGLVLPLIRHPKFPALPPANASCATFCRTRSSASFSGRSMATSYLAPFGIIWTPRGIHSHLSRLLMH